MMNTEQPGLNYTSYRTEQCGILTLVLSFWVYGEYHLVSLTLPWRLIKSTKLIYKSAQKKDSDFKRDPVQC